MRHEPVHRAELIDAALNRFTPSFFEKWPKIDHKLTKITVFGRAEPIFFMESWKNAENSIFFLKSKLNNYWSSFGKKCGVNRFMPQWFICIYTVYKKFLKSCICPFFFDCSHFRTFPYPQNRLCKKVIFSLFDAFLFLKTSPLRRFSFLFPRFYCFRRISLRGHLHIT